MKIWCDEVSSWSYGYNAGQNENLWSGIDVKKLIYKLVSVASVLPAMTVSAESKLEQVSIQPAQPETYQACVLRLIESATTTTAEEIKYSCKQQQLDSERLASVSPESPISERMEGESLTLFENFSLTPHKPNYLLPISYNQNPNDVLAQVDDRLALDKTEVQFQVSLKVPVATKIFASEWDIYAAYTGRSFWQAYNNDVSSPFRDTNHEPEVWMSRSLDMEAGPLVARALRFGFVHQSNGRSQPLSRSWNRIYADFIFEVDDFSFSFKPWYRIDEDEKKDPLDPAGDDNPDIDEYMGNFELLSAYKYNDHTFSMMLRNNLESDNHGAVDLSWSFPLNDKMKGYVKYFNGYGETLLDYNHRSNRLSIGFVVADWL